MEAILWIAAAAIIFGICYAVDTGFQKLFRSKAQHMSGMAVRASKRYGVFGVILFVLGLAALLTGIGGDKVLQWGGCAVLLLGVCFIVHYLSFGIFYDGESFLVSAFAKKSMVYRFRDIESQKLYLITGGNIVIELLMTDGKTVSLQSSLDGFDRFMDTAFAGWCLQRKIDPQSCAFYDPGKSWWFPHEEEL